MGQRSIILQIQSQNKINKTKLWIKKQVKGNRKNKQSNQKKKTKTKTNKQKRHDKPLHTGILITIITKSNHIHKLALK